MDQATRFANWPVPDNLRELLNTKRVIIQDVESNGLMHATADGIPAMTKIHCMTAEDIFSNEHFDWGPGESAYPPHVQNGAVGTGIEWMMDEVGVIIGHNWENFDRLAIRYVVARYWPTLLAAFDEWLAKVIILDTLILCKMLYPADALIGPDMKLFHTGRLPGGLIKRQSLAAWGCRIGENKGDYKGGWAEWSPEMHTYMVQDGVTNKKLFALLERRLGWTPDEPKNSEAQPSSQPSSSSSAGAYVWPWLPVHVEHQIVRIITEQEDVGVGFDRPKAEALSAELGNEEARLTAKLQAMFGTWWAPKDNPTKGRTAKRTTNRKLPEFPNVTVPRYGKTGKRLKDYVGPPLETTFEGAPFVRIEYTTFNPSSREHLANRLQKVYGWKPEQFTKGGAAQLDEGAIKGLPDSVINEEDRYAILAYFVTSKTRGMLADGKKSWLAFAGGDGRIHGRVDPLGTITHRATHFNPNLAQIPSVRVDGDKEIILGLKGGYGHECRELFVAVSYPGGLADNYGQVHDDGMWELTGVDMSSLEFIILGHYLQPLDDGIFAERVGDPARDPHQEHADLTGIASRRDAKTAGYLIIFGGGAWKCGDAVGVERSEIGELLSDRGLAGRLRFMRKRLGAEYEEPSDIDKAKIVKGGRIINQFLEGIQGFKFLKQDLTATGKERGWIKALDGRKLLVRKPHATLATVMQGGGSVACKLWIVLFHKMMRATGYEWRRDYNQVLWVHDELQIEHRKGLGPEIARIANEAAKEAGRQLGLRGEFRTEAKTGHNWAETH